MASSFHLWHPWDTLANEQLNRRLRIVQSIRVVHHANLNDLVRAKRCAVSPQGRAAIAAEVAGDRFSAVGRLRDLLGAALDLETFAGDDDVRRISRASYLLAISAMAERLLMLALTGSE